MTVDECSVGVYVLESVSDTMATGQRLKVVDPSEIGIEVSKQKVAVGALAVTRVFQ